MAYDSTRRTLIRASGAVALTALAGCTSIGNGGDSSGDSMTTDTMGDGSMDDGMEPMDPMSAEQETIDRFSEAAGTLHVRTEENGLPDAGEPIDFDDGFLAQGLGPNGEIVQYYDFDVMPTAPAPIYAFFHENGDPVAGQLNVVGTIPGDDDYNDFWQVTKVTVPDDYEANSITSAAALMDASFETETTNIIKNCPIVPAGSTASKRYGDGTKELVQGWYHGKIVNYFLFEEASIEANGGAVPISPIYVTFNKNPDEDGGGPASGFKTEEMGAQTHNVVATVPEDADYSPLWVVNIYDNADFETVSDLESAMSASILATGAATVNCPLVSVGE